jgi:hypothetical protein
LALAQECEQERLPIRKLKRIMVHVRLRSIDLTEDCSLVPGRTASAVGANFAVESKLSARKTRVPVPKLLVRSLSPTLAVRDLTCIKL